MAKELTEQQPMRLTEIIEKSDDVRKRLLEVLEVEPKDIAPSMFDYVTSKNTVGLNIIGNVNLGYASAQVGDHLAKRNPYIHELEEHVRLMEISPNAVAVLNGNIFSFVPKAVKTSLLTPETQLAYTLSLFKNLADQGKIIAMIPGNSERKAEWLHKQQYMKMLAIGLGQENKLCNEASINISFLDDYFGDVDVKMRSANWKNVAFTADYMNKTLHKRALENPGSDIYFASTAVNTFSIERHREIEGGKEIEKPIYLVTSGPYTPYMGSDSVIGGEYNSIRSRECAPNAFWTEISAVKSSTSDGHEILAQPKHYHAHQTLQRDKDEIAVKINNQKRDVIEILGNIFMQKLVDEKEDKSKESVVKIRETLENNESVIERNDAIREYRDYKKGIVAEEENNRTIDGISDAERAGVQAKTDVTSIVIDKEDNDHRARFINEILSPDVAGAESQVVDSTSRYTQPVVANEDTSARINIRKIESEKEEKER